MGRVVVRHGPMPDGEGGLLAAVAAELTGCHPAAVGVIRRCPRCGGPHGRPIPEVPGRHAWVSLARSPGTVVAAAARRPVGVDVEEGDPADAALRTWVRKEAILKATGDGVLLDPDRLVLGPAEEPPRILEWRFTRRPPPLRVVDLDLGSDRLAALAVATRGRVRLDVQVRR